jgi:hypothetical protein
MPAWMQAAGIVAVVALVAWYVKWSGQRAEEQTLASHKARWAREDEERAQRDKEEREFRESAKIVRARVLSADQTWTDAGTFTGSVNQEPEICLSLMVEIPEEEAYKVEVTKRIKHTELHRFAEGSMVDVYADPNNRERVVLCDPEIAAMDREFQEEMAKADKLLDDE